jgi:hypothetical protein
MDALLCGEGWDGPVERLLTESIQILNRPPSNHDDSNHNHPAHGRTTAVRICSFRIHSPSPQKHSSKTRRQHPILWNGPFDDPKATLESKFR